MPERDPFKEERRVDINDMPSWGRYAVETEKKSRNKFSVFGEKKEDPLGEDHQKVFQKKRRNAWVVGGIVVLSIVIAAGIFAGISWYEKNLFRDDRVSVEIQGPDRVSGGNTERFLLKYKNENAISLENAVVSFRFPKNFVPEERNGLKRDGVESARLEIGTIAPGQETSFDLYGYFSATTDPSVYIRATLRFSPKDSSGTFEKETQKSVAMESSIVDVGLSIPLEAAAGDSVEIGVQYVNRGDTTLFSARLQMEYPEGFVFQESNMPPSEGNAVWYLEPLEPGTPKMLKIRGRIEGNRDAQKHFAATIGTVRGDASFVAYGKDQKDTRIIGSPFSIQSLINGGNIRFVSLGTELETVVQYANEGDVGMKDAIIRVVLEGDIFDTSFLSIDERGSYDGSTKTITWRASDVPELAFMDPGETGSVKFKVPIRKVIPIKTKNDTQLSGSMIASIDSVDVPARIGTKKIVAQNRVDLPLISSGMVVVDIHEEKTGLDLSDIPFTVGKQTEVLANIRIRNTYNDLIEGKLTLSLPSGVEFSGNVSVDGNESAEYNERSQQIVWDAGKVDAGTGILRPDRTIAFRMRVTPQEHQSEQQLTLLSNIEFRSRDSFVGEPVTFSIEKIFAPRVLPKGKEKE